jgi:hypothetical protein
MNKFIWIATLFLGSGYTLMPNTAHAQCIIFCGVSREGAHEFTQATGTTSLLSVLSPVTTTEGSTEDMKRTFTQQERESARFYVASDGAIEDVHFTSAMRQFGDEEDESRLSKMDIAMLISSQGE